MLPTPLVRLESLHVVTHRVIWKGCNKMYDQANHRKAEDTAWFS